MKQSTLYKRIPIVLIGLLIAILGTAQSYYHLDYECLNEPLEFNDYGELTYFIECTDGVAEIDTLEKPCIEGFYGQDDYNIRAFYYNYPGAGSTTEFAFGNITLKENEDFDGMHSKYFELNQTTLWYYFTQSENSIQRLSIKVKDIGEAGINFGTELGIGPVFYANFEELADHNFEDISVHYEDDILTIEGELERLFIGGDHIYVSDMWFNEFTTETKTEEAISSIQLYPNPTSRFLILEGEDLANAQVIVSDFTGRTILSEYPSSEHLWEIDLTTFPTGPYWIRVIKNKEVAFSKIVLKH